MNPKYPIYVITKGRWQYSHTAKLLNSLNIPFNLVVEPQEYNNYKDISKNIIVLPFSNLDQGSIPARNYVWEHSIESGYDKHWVLDDNIDSFYRLNKNEKNKVTSGTIFKCAEDFVDRYENIGIAGFNYHFFCDKNNKIPPFYLNTRIYSCMLIKNDIKHRFRGKYNEDTDLSLRVLKDGFCTVLFNAFLIGKLTTMKLKGGNTNELYVKTNNRKEFAESLLEQHPDVVEVVWKYNRWHHKVNYDSFKNNKLIFKSDLIIPNKINEYGMVLEEIEPVVKESKKLAGLKPPNSKKMVMVDSDGNLVKIYESAKDCSYDSGYSYDQVYDRLREKYENNLGHKFYYLDKYDGEYDLDKDLYIKPNGEDNDVFVYKIKNVVICNSNNELIKIVLSVAEAEREFGVNHAAIRRRLSGKHRNQGEYYFHFESDWNDGNLDRFVESDKNKPTAIVKYNLITDSIIEEYNSINEAAKMNNIDAGIIRRKCDGKKSRQSINNSKLDNNISFRYK